MIFNLIKKDIIVIKKYILLLLIFSTATPILYSIFSVDISNKLIYTVVCIYTSAMTLQYLSLNEYKYTKANKILLVTSYKKRDIIISKYIVLFLMSVISTLIYVTESIFYNSLEKLRFEDITITFSIILLFISITIPFEYKYGYEKTKYIFMIIILIVPIALGYIGKYVGEMSNFISSKVLINIIPILIIVIIITFISIFISIKTYNSQDISE